MRRSAGEVRVEPRDGVLCAAEQQEVGGGEKEVGLRAARGVIRQREHLRVPGDPRRQPAVERGVMGGEPGCKPREAPR